MMPVEPAGFVWNRGIWIAEVGSEKINIQFPILPACWQAGMSNDEGGKIFLSS